MNNENFYSIPSDAFKDKIFDKTVIQYPKGSLVYLEIAKQFGKVEEVKPSAEGPRIKVKFIGLVPIDELRPATDEEIKKFNQE